MPHILNDEIIEHLLDVFKLKPQHNYQIKDCAPILLKPIFMFDMSMEVFYNIPIVKLTSEELKHYKIIKKFMNDFEAALFDGLSIENKDQLSESMSDFIEYVNNDITLLKKSFNNFLTDSYNLEYKELLSQLYVLSTLCQIVSLYLTSLKHKKSKDCILIDYLNKTSYRVLRIQRTLDKRANKTNTSLNPNIDDNIVKQIDNLVTTMFNYF
jgi:hypothetical protein